MKAVRVIVHGRVQGVGFRWFTRDAASSHGVLGWVRNRRDGTVEAQLQGADDAVDAMLAQLRDGPRGGLVDRLTTSDAAAEAVDGFEIRSTE